MKRDKTKEPEIMRTTLKTIKTSFKSAKMRIKTAAKLKKFPFYLTDGAAMDRSLPSPA
jgi:hypothetical protein